jgi:hypothetical protein
MRPVTCFALTVLGTFTLACAFGKKDKDTEDTPTTHGGGDADTDADADSDTDSDTGLDDGNDTGLDTNTHGGGTYSPVFINFDEQSASVTVDELYEEVTFVVDAPYHLILGNFGQYYSAPWMAYPSNASAGYEMVFTRPVNALTFVVTGADQSVSIATVDVTTEDGAVVTVDLPGATDGWFGYEDFTRFEDITSLKIYDVTDAASFGIDDLSFRERDN